MNDDAPAAKSDVKTLDAKIDGVRRELKGDIFKTHAKMDRMEERLTGLIRGESEKTISRMRRGQRMWVLADYEKARQCHDFGYVLRHVDGQ